MKILFLPFMKMQTGHHTVADALIRSLQARVSNISCSKIDFFSYADKLLEKAFRMTYLTWIDHSPQTFVKIYHNFVYPTKSTKHFFWYELKFIDKMRTLLAEQQPDLIICTQAFPSFLLSRLRYSGTVIPPVINIYTDFFINKLWGINGIDYHFVPDKEIKAQLVTRYNLNASNIYITGIPVDECFLPRSTFTPIPPYRILISGGSNGLGDIERLISNLPQGNQYYFYLLCGNNKKLYKEILGLGLANLQPLTFITSREDMNRLYNQADAIITKSGGVTLSEAIHKRLPIFIHSSLPGQEQVNKEYLLKRQLIYNLDSNDSVTRQLDFFFNNKDEQLMWLKRTEGYINQIEGPAWQKITEIMVKELLKPKYQELLGITRSSG